jgi:hypothetical protein
MKRILIVVMVVILLIFTVIAWLFFGLRRAQSIRQNCYKEAWSGSQRIENDLRAKGYPKTTIDEQSINFERETNNECLSRHGMSGAGFF